MKYFDNLLLHLHIFLFFKDKLCFFSFIELQVEHALLQVLQYTLNQRPVIINLDFTQNKNKTTPLLVHFNQKHKENLRWMIVRYRYRLGTYIKDSYLP